MIQCCWNTLQTFSQKLQGTSGAIAVLHTHSRRLDYHPHVHMIMPAAAIDTLKRLWRTKTNKSKGKSNKPYLFNHKALAKVFRAKMLEAVTQERLALPARYPERSGLLIVNLLALARRRYRGVIQEKDIVACENGKVTFRYQKQQDKAD